MSYFAPLFLPCFPSPNQKAFLQVKKAIDADPSIKLIFLCSPGNPTGTLISLESMRAILDYEPFKGIVVVDEAYIDFSEPGSSAASLVAKYANICVMQTLSKSFGLAAIRCASFRLTHPRVPSLTLFLADSASRSLNRHSSRSSRTPRHLTTSPRRRPSSHYALCRPRR